MNNDLFNDAATTLQTIWGLQKAEVVSEEELLQMLEEKIVHILEQGPEAFFQIMYRIDISEKKLNAVTEGENPARGIARLVYDRQIAKIISRRENKQNKDNIDPDLEW